MRSFLVAGLVASAAVATDMDQREFEFMRWLSEHNKSYGTMPEYAKRLAVWLEVDDYVLSVNAPDSGHGHRAAHNKFSDYTREEFRAMLSLGNNAPGMKPAYNNPLPEGPAEPTASADVDWRNSGCLTAIKDQGQCGSCYAFSATETVESSYCIEHAKLYTLSPQQIVDCTTGYGNSGCNGGWYWNAWSYLTTNGQEEESAYPYVGVETSCTYNASLGKVSTTTSGIPCPGNPTAMRSAVEGMPMSIAVQADSHAFQTYSTGTIMQYSGCGTAIDHAIQAVGYSTGGPTDYWIIRNSWGTTWGQQGFGQVEMTDCQYGGVCGICEYPYTVDTKAFSG